MAGDDSLTGDRGTGRPEQPEPSETTPLLARSDTYDEDEELVIEHTSRSDSTAEGPANGNDSGSRDGKRRRWPSILALSILCVTVILIMVGGFLAPEAVEEYTKEAMVVEPIRLSIESYTEDGVRARIQAEFSMDASRVKKKAVRDVGRFGTWLMSQVESREASVEVRAPERGNVLLGTAKIPAIKVSIRNGHVTPLDFVADLGMGDKEGIRSLATDWVEGRLSKVRVEGRSNIKLKSGIFSLPSQLINKSYLLGGSESPIPSIPEPKIADLKLREDVLPDGAKGLVAEVSVKIPNNYPVELQIPPIGFDVLAPGCNADAPKIPLANAYTHAFRVRPKTEIGVNATGFLSRLPSEFIETCPGSHSSPFDSLLADYLHEKTTVLFIRGSKLASDRTPQWIIDLMSGVTLPVPVTGRTFGHLIRNFSLTDVHFELPDFSADPDSPESNPRVSANIEALIAIPEEADIPIDVVRVKALADVFYEGNKLGYLDLHKWQNATSKPVQDIGKGQPGLLVQSRITEVPLTVTDDDVFADVVQALFLGEAIMLKIEAKVDVDVRTALGDFIVRKIPAEGQVPVKPPHDRNLDSLSPKVGELKIIETSPSHMVIGAKVNFTNPTKYSASIPYASLNVLVNDTALGHILTQDVSIVPGNNTNVPVQLVWEPQEASGPNGTAVEREFLSQFLSGYNTTLTLQTYEGTIPALPSLGKALSFLTIDIPTPKFATPKDPDGGDGDGDEKHNKPHFIQDTTMHLLTSRATFSLNSPLKYTTLYITHLNATSYHEGNVAGKILYDGSIEVPPGIHETPRLPVDWNLGSVGYEAIRKALGGTLQLDAYAITGLRIDKYELTVWYAGTGIGAKIRL